jgi:biotin/methionine sulfoxide reductase
MLLHPGAPFAYDGGRHAYPDIRMIYWAGGNPFHHHQDLNRLEQAWEKPETIVVHEPFWTPTAKRADIVLPVTTTLERADIGFARSEGFLVAMDRIARPLGEAQDDYAIFSQLAARLGVEEAYTEGRDAESWMRAMYEACRPGAARAGVVLPEYDAFWQAGIVDYSEIHAPRVMLQKFRADPGVHPLITPSGKIEIFSEKVAGFALADCPGFPVWREPAEWLGSPVAKTFPLHLVSDQPVRRLHSQLDHSPHSRAGKVHGREQVTISPADAAARGVASGDLVEIFNDRGRCLAAADVSDVIAPGVLRLSTGAWFDLAADGLETHGNPNAVTLDRGASGLSQGCSAQTCLVDVKRFEGVVPEIRAFELPVFFCEQKNGGFKFGSEHPPVRAG